MYILHGGFYNYLIVETKVTPTQQLFSYIIREQVNFQWDADEIRFVLDLYSASSLKQLSVDRHVAPHYPDSKPSSICSYSLVLRA